MEVLTPKLWRILVYNTTKFSESSGDPWQLCSICISIARTWLGEWNRSCHTSPVSCSDSRVMGWTVLSWVNTVNAWVLKAFAREDLWSLSPRLYYSPRETLFSITRLLPPSGLVPACLLVSSAGHCLWNSGWPWVLQAWGRAGSPSHSIGSHSPGWCHWAAPAAAMTRWCSAWWRWPGAWWEQWKGLWRKEETGHRNRPSITWEVPSFRDKEGEKCH